MDAVVAAIPYAKRGLVPLDPNNVYAADIPTVDWLFWEDFENGSKFATNRAYVREDGADLNDSYGMRQVMEAQNASWGTEAEFEPTDDVYIRFYARLDPAWLNGGSGGGGGAGATASYTVSAVNLPPVSVIDFQITVDGSFFSAKELICASGFVPFSTGNYGSELYWKNDGDIWTGKAVLLNAAGVGVSGDFDIFTMVFDAVEGKLGITEVTLDYIVLSYAGAGVDAEIIDGTVTTLFEQWFSPYDLTKDGVVDLHDLSFALQYLLVTDQDAEWSVAQALDFDPNGIIDINDLLLILANYTIPYYG